MKTTPCTKQQIMSPCSLKDLNYQIDPYIGCEHYCYYCYALNKAETDWRSEILYHENAIKRLETELSKIPPQTIYMGWETDPYQPCEAEEMQTRRVLELLQKHGFSVSILTKSNLVLRDLDVLQKMDEPCVSFSMTFTSADDRQHFEANTVETEARIEAMEKLKLAGIRSSVLLCPVIPYITDVMSVIDSVRELADKIWIYGLSILDRSDQNWQNVERILDRHYALLKSQVEEVVLNKDHEYWSTLRNKLLQVQQKQKLNLEIHI